MLNLDGKQWPKSPLKEKNLNAEQLKQFLRIRADYEKSAFVTEGHLEVRALGAKEFTKPIPPGESGITALVLHANGRIYGGTSGRKAHLFFYNPAPDADAVADIGIVAEDAVIPKLIALPDGVILGIVNEKGKGGRIFTYKPCEVLLQEENFIGMGVREIFDLPAEDQLFFSTIDPCHSAGKIEILDTPLQHEHIADILPDRSSADRLYLLGGESGILFAYNRSSREVQKIGRYDPNGNFSKCLTGDSDGRVYGAGLYGEIFRYDPETNRFEPLNVFAPSIKGRELYNRVTSWCYDNKAGIVYGGTTDGIIFKFLPQENRIICLGKPNDQSNVIAMTLSGNILYILTGHKDDCCHLSSYDDTNHELRDLGCLLARSERPWNGYTFSSMTTGMNGTVFLGENDRISQLFMYFPPIK